ncbi:YdcF family protein [Candidatus Micrarchaeota archaeon]|nr:YdcF family protein [Candidatus Micrarchaeota archaeon]
MDRFQNTVTQANRVGVVDNRAEDVIEVHQSLADARRAVDRMAFGSTVRQKAYHLLQGGVWDFEHSDGGWAVKPHVTTYLNGVKMGKTPMYLDAGDILSALPHGDGSFAVHARVPIENEAPLKSRDFAHVLMHKNAEPQAYKRVIAVLGGRINEDGTLTERVDGRVRIAVDEFLKSYDRGVPAAMVFSGGPPRYAGNFAEGETEAKAMQRRALQMMIDERPEFKNFPDVLKHIMFREERSLDAVGNAYFLRKFLESKENRKFFKHVQKVDVIIEEKYENRFRDAFAHIFQGMRFGLRYQNPPALNQRESDEEMRRMDGREQLMVETKAGDLNAIGRFLQKNHGLYKDKPLAYFFIRPNWYKDRFQPWAENVGDPWVKEKGKEAWGATKAAGRRTGTVAADLSRKAVQHGVPALRQWGQAVARRMRQMRRRGR